MILLLRKHGWLDHDDGAPVAFKDQPSDVDAFGPSGDHFRHEDEASSPQMAKRLEGFLGS